MASWEPRVIVRLRLHRDSVDELFGVAEQPATTPAPEPSSQQEQPPQPSGSATQSAKKTSRAKRRERARQAIEAMWPDGVPNQTIISNGQLCKRVADWLKEDCKRRKVPPEQISDDTILRAAGRQA
jgi:hypothetical protein